MVGCKVYIGGLPLDVKERELDDLFAKFGRIRYIDIKNNQPRPPAFAFIEYEDPRDAEDAVRRRDGQDFCPGHRMRVEIARGTTGVSREAFSRRPPPPSGYRVIVKGLPKGCSWQDLKDHVRRACKPQFTDVRRDADGNVIGIVEFETRDDMDLAIRKLDDTEFRNPRYEPGHYTRLVEDTTAYRGGKYGQEDERGRGRSRSRSPARRDDSRGRSGSPARDRERARRDDYDDEDRGRGGGGARDRSRSPRDRSRSPRDRSRSPRDRSRSPRERSRSR